MITPSLRKKIWNLMHKEEISTSHYIDHERCSRCSAKRNVLYGNIPMVIWSNPDPVPRYCEGRQEVDNALD